ncbi:MAG: hypothetical protein NVS3B10_27480 [Polyangiales bacterium]
MEGLLARLDRRFGKWAIRNFTHYLVGLTGLVFVLTMLKPQFLGALSFVPSRVIYGHEYWRVVTFLFIPHSSNPLWIIFELWFLWLVGNSLEGAWGAFKFNVYYFLGALCTIASAFVFGVGVGNEYLNDSLFLAFATIFPAYQLLILFFPVRAKWLGLLTAAFLAYQVVVAPLPVKMAIGIAMGNYLLFFGRHLFGVVRGTAAVAGRAKKRAEFLPAQRVSSRPARTCVLCGKTDDDPGADLRVCTCQAVCLGKPTIYCLEHARSHQHAQA